jgi:hypothetical protein
MSTRSVIDLNCRSAASENSTIHCLHCTPCPSILKLDLNCRSAASEKKAPSIDPRARSTKSSNGEEAVLDKGSNTYRPWKLYVLCRFVQPNSIPTTDVPSCKCITGGSQFRERAAMARNHCCSPDMCSCCVRESGCHPASTICSVDPDTLESTPGCLLPHMV